MSLIVSVYVPTGIVVSGDSRTTATRHHRVPDPGDPANTVTVRTEVVLSDSAHKVFLVHGRFGVGTFGDAIVDDLPIAHHVQAYEDQTAAAPPATTREAADRLLRHFRELRPVPNVRFLVAGYDGADPWVVGVDVQDDRTERVNADAQTGRIEYGLVRGGDTAVVDRLLSQQEFHPPFNLMSLQDAVDFSRYLIRSTIDQQRFEPRFAAVGGPIDTVVVSPGETRFLAQKTLSAT